jgi:hypothetical protein
VLRGEATNTNFIIFGLTRSENEPTFYSTGDEHANHNTTDAVNFDSKVTGNSGFLQYLLSDMSEILKVQLCIPMF